MANGFSDRTDHSDEEATSVWRKYMGDTTRWHGFPAEMSDLWTYGDDSETRGRKRLSWICRGIKRKSRAVGSTFFAFLSLLSFRYTVFYPPVPGPSQCQDLWSRLLHIYQYSSLSDMVSEPSGYDAL